MVLHIGPKCSNILHVPQALWQSVPVLCPFETGSFPTELKCLPLQVQFVMTPCDPMLSIHFVCFETLSVQVCWCLVMHTSMHKS